MRKKSSVSFGPGASSLILIFVVLSMSVLGMLALINGRNDSRLSTRSLQVIESVYQLNERAEARRAELDRILVALERITGGTRDGEEFASALELLLPEGVTLEDGALCWEETDGTRVLDCALALLPAGGEGRTAWIRHDLSAQTAEEEFM